MGTHLFHLQNTSKTHGTCIVLEWKSLSCASPLSWRCFFMILETILIHIMMQMRKILKGPPGQSAAPRLFQHYSLLRYYFVVASHRIDNNPSRCILSGWESPNLILSFSTYATFIGRRFFLGGFSFRYTSMMVVVTRSRDGGGREDKWKEELTGLGNTGIIGGWKWKDCRLCLACCRVRPGYESYSCTD